MLGLCPVGDETRNIQTGCAHPTVDLPDARGGIVGETGYSARRAWTGSTLAALRDGR
jgi:hypothetical protein